MNGLKLFVRLGLDNPASLETSVLFVAKFRLDGVPTDGTRVGSLIQNKPEAADSDLVRKRECCRF